MQFWIIIRIAVRGLLANKLRSFLTMLGVIIGVGSVIAMLAIGEGAKRAAMAQIEKFGVSTLTLRPGARGSMGAKLADTQNLTLADGEAILRDLPGVVGIAPEVATSGASVVCKANSTRTRVIGSTPDYLPVRSFRIDRGRMFTQEEDAAARMVCVLGPKVVEDLFPNEGDDPLGAEIKISGKIFTVIGTVEAKGDQGFFNPDSAIYIPIQAAIKRVLGATAGASGSLQAIHVKFDAGGADVIAQMAANEKRLDRLMRARHKIGPFEAPDFQIRNMAEWLKESEETNRTFTVLLGSVAGISLLVGGIGIMNIMLVTVTERTREIGIRKALGARTWDILKQFVIEAVVVSMLGGLAGIAAGLGAAALIPRLNQWFPAVPRFETAPTVSSVVMSFAFAAVIGVFFGFYPARKAARLDPIDALRYE
jgi:putative ABC transport system permease protein